MYQEFTDVTSAKKGHGLKFTFAAISMLYYCLKNIRVGMNPNNLEENRMRVLYRNCFIALILLSTSWLFIWPFRVLGDCMEPAIKDGHFYLLNHLSPHIRSFRVGDIIVFKHEGKRWISRIVGLEKDTIQINEGNITLNGTILQDSTIDRNWTNWRQGEYGLDKPFQIPHDHVYVLSDNLSAQHDDSRVFGPVSKSSIVGIVW